MAHLKKSLFVIIVLIMNVLSSYSQLVKDYKRVSNQPFPNAERFENRSFGKKVGRSTWEVLTMEAGSALFLIAMPLSFTNWPEKYWLRLDEHFVRAYTNPPVWDHDIWVANYLGHPYQGAVFYNSMRSQNASILLSTGNVLFHTLLWEYGIEALMEQPSIQDLIVTPLAGVFFGELFHYLTLKFARNGFTTWEMAAIFLFNPCYAINNGFK